MPTYQQYLEMKRNHPDAVILFRNGNFHYITFAEDARLLVELLDITLTRRPDGNDFVDAACFPNHALLTCLQTLVKAGTRVAIYE